MPNKQIMYGFVLIGAVIGLILGWVIPPKTIETIQLSSLQKTPDTYALQRIYVSGEFVENFGITSEEKETVGFTSPLFGTYQSYVTTYKFQDSFGNVIIVKDNQKSDYLIGDKITLDGIWIKNRDGTYYLLLKFIQPKN